MISFGEMKKVFQGKNIFITGVSGFCGPWLIALLTKLGVSSIVGVHNGNVNQTHFKLLTRELFGTEDKPKGKVEVFFDKLDISKRNKSNDEILQDMVDHADIIIHLAAETIVKESYDRPNDFFNSNVVGTQVILEHVRKSCNKSQVVLFVTTDKVYKNNSEGKPFMEDDPLGGHDVYAASKACCEIMINSYRDSFFNRPSEGLQVIKSIATARSGNIFGGGDWAPFRLVPDIMAAKYEKHSRLVIRNPYSIRPWTFILDSLWGYLSVIHHMVSNKVKYETSFNFSPSIEEAVSVEELAQLFKVDYTIQADTSNKEDKILTLNSDKAKAILNWSPVFSIATAAKMTDEWYNQFINDGELITNIQINELIRRLGD